MLSRTPLFEGGFDTGDLTQWRVQRADPDRIRVVHQPAADGAFAARFEVRPGDFVANGNRAEVYARDGRSGWPDGEGSERYYGWSTFIPEAYPTDPLWQTLVQWKGEASGSPPLAIGLEGDRLNVTSRGPSGENSRKLWQDQIRTGRWERFVMHVRWSPDPSTGFVEFWRDGTLVLPRTPTSTMLRRENGETVQNYLKLGLYRSRGIATTQALYHDAARIGLRYEDVAD